MRSGLNIATVSPDKDPDNLSIWFESISLVINGLGHQVRDPSVRCDNRIIGDIEMVFYNGGTGYVTIEDRTYRCTAGDLVVIPPYTVHHIRSDSLDPHDCLWTHIDVKPEHNLLLLVDLLLPDRSANVIRLKNFEDGTIPTLFSHVAEELRTWPPGAVEMARILLSAAVLRTIRHAHKINGKPIDLRAHRPSPIIERVLVHINENIHRKINVDQLCEIARCGRSKLFELFGQRFGIGPMTFVQWQRVRLAETLLRTTRLTIQEISDQVGIRSPFHLSRCFKDQYGVSPRVYRETMCPWNTNSDVWT